LKSKRTRTTNIIRAGNEVLKVRRTINSGNTSRMKFIYRLVGTLVLAVFAGTRIAWCFIWLMSNLN